MASTFVQLPIKGASVAGLALKADLISPLLVTPNIGAATATSVVSSGENSARNFNHGQQQIVSSATPIVLTASSPYETVLIGSAAQVVTMPVVSTLVLGKRFRITAMNGAPVNTVNSSGGNLITNLSAYGPNYTSVEYVCVLVTGTNQNSWALTNGAANAYGNDTSNNLACWPLMRYPNVGIGMGNSIISSNLIMNPGTGTSFAKNFASGYSTTTTATSTTTLLVSSNRQQFFSGSAIQNCDLPVASTMLYLGMEFEIINLSTGVVTVRSSGANSVQAMAANTRAVIKCILQSGTTAASWLVTDYTGEVVESTVVIGSAVSLTNATPANVTSVTLTAGHWDCIGANVHFIPAAGTIPTLLTGSINTVSATQATSPNGGAFFQLGVTLPAGVTQVFPMCGKRISITTTTTFYLVATANFTVDTLTAAGYLGFRKAAL